MTLEPYQESAVQWLASRKYGLIKSSPGSGKTVIAAAALDRVITSKKRFRKVFIGWLCNTIEQKEQAQKAMNAFPSIGALADVQVECAAADVDWSNTDVLICDEIHHHAHGGLWGNQIATAKGALWGFTATPETGDHERDAALIELFHEQFTVDRAEVSKSRLVPARVILLDASDDCGPLIDKAIDDYFKRFRNRWRVVEVRQLQKELPSESAQRALGEIWGQLKSIAAWQGVASIGITGNKIRTDAAISTARHHAKRLDQGLVLVNHTGHGEQIATELIQSGVPTALAHSKMGAKKRREALQAFRERRIQCLVATSLADEGLDLPSINVLVLVSGGRSRIKAEQRTGRALRAFAGKTEAIIYDFQDRQHRLMEKHAKARQALYRELGYKIEGEL